MPAAQTFLSQTVEWQGFTWTFQNPVQYGFYINGDPFVVVPSGQGVTLTGVLPAPRFISQSEMTASTGPSTIPAVPLNQLPGWIVSGSALNVQSPGSYTALSGSTAVCFGIMPNANNTDFGLYINGTVKNPVRCKSPQILTGPSLVTGLEKVVIPDQLSTSGITQCFHSRGRHLDSVQSHWKFDANEWNKLLNMGTNPISLVAGDMLMSLQCPYKTGQGITKYGLISGSDTLTHQSTTVPYRQGGIASVDKVGLLSFVSSVPDEDSFRPPFIWTDPTNRPTGFTYGSIPTGRTAAFIDIPTKTIDGTGGIIYKTSLSYGKQIGGSGGIPCPFDSVSVNDLLPAPLPYFPFVSGRGGNAHQKGDNVPTWNFLRRTLSEMADTAGVTLSTSSDSGLQDSPIGKAVGIANAIYPSFYSTSGSLIGSGNVTAVYAPPIVAEMMMAYNAVNCFANWLSDADRKKCLIRQIQYGIDLYGCYVARQMPNAGYFGDNDRSQDGPPPSSHPTIRIGSLIVENPRPFIILAGWLLNNQDMMNIDSSNADRCNGIYAASVATGMTFAEWNIGGTADINAAIMFHEVYKYRKLGGTWTNSTGITTGRGFWYTDPGTTADVGIGYGLKNNIGQDGQLGVEVAFAGETWGNEPISFLDSPVSPAFSIPVSTSQADTFAIIGATAYCGKGSGSPPGNSGYYQFPKTNNTSAYYASGSAPNTPAGTKIVAQNLITNLLYTNVRIISGPGSGPTVYKIIKILNRSTVDTFLANTQAFTWTGQNQVRFLLDKPWQSGTPTSESRFIIYPFDSSDIGKYVQSRHFPLAAAAWSSLNTVNHNSSKESGWAFSIASRMSMGNAGTSTDKTCLVMYGLLYALGKRSGGNIILENPRTLNVIDAIIDLTFSTQPHAHTEYFFDTSPYLDTTDEYNSTVMFVHRTNSLHKKQRFLGGILRSLWQREVPMSRS